MKKFKLLFHICYVVIAFVVLYFSIDVLLNTEDYLSKIKISSYLRFPRYVMVAFLFMSVIMLFEFVLERVNVYHMKGGMEGLELEILELKDGIEGLELEILELKAKLYDKSQDDNSGDEDDIDGEDDKEDGS